MVLSPVSGIGGTNFEALTAVDIINEYFRLKQAGFLTSSDVAGAAMSSKEQNIRGAIFSIFPVIHRVIASSPNNRPIYGKFSTTNDEQQSETLLHSFVHFAFSFIFHLPRFSLLQEIFKYEQFGLAIADMHIYQLGANRQSRISSLEWF